MKTSEITSMFSALADTNILEGLLGTLGVQIPSKKPAEVQPASNTNAFILALAFMVALLIALVLAKK